MQQEQLTLFFTRLVLIIIFIMMLAVIAIPEIVSMFDDACEEPSEPVLWINGVAVMERPQESVSASPVAAGPLFDVGLE
jgi:hypothetical protein